MAMILLASQRVPHVVSESLVLSPLSIGSSLLLEGITVYNKKILKKVYL